MQDRENFTQNAILVQIELFKLKTKNSQKNSLSEFKELALSSGAEIFGEVIGKQDRPSAKFYLKQGKAEEVKNIVVKEEPVKIIEVKDTLVKEEKAKTIKELSNKLDNIEEKADEVY